MRTVRAEIWIEAPPEAVWAVLADVDGWGTWNDVMVDGRSEARPGGRIAVKVRIGPAWFPVRSRLAVWEPGRALEWGEDRGRLIRVHHGLTLEPVDGGTRVQHYESFGGVLGRLVFPVVRRPLTRDYAAFLESLRSRVLR